MSFRVTQAQADELFQQALRSGQSLSAYLRGRIFGELSVVKSVTEAEVQA